MLWFSANMFTMRVSQCAHMSMAILMVVRVVMPVTRVMRGGVFWHMGLCVFLERGLAGAYGRLIRRTR
jgi:hypothetical protein